MLCLQANIEGNSDLYFSYLLLYILSIRMAKADG